MKPSTRAILTMTGACGTLAVWVYRGQNMTKQNTLRASDPIEQELREKWYATRDAGNWAEHRAVDAQLSRYIWSRTERDIAADRAKHPKARRNQPKSSDALSNRVLP